MVLVILAIEVERMQVYRLDEGGMAAREDSQRARPPALSPIVF